MMKTGVRIITVILSILQMSSVFSSQGQFCPSWDKFCRFAYIIKLGDHFCGRTGLMNVSALVMLCSRPNSCCQQNLKCFNMPLLS